MVLYVFIPLLVPPSVLVEKSLFIEYQVSSTDYILNEYVTTDSNISWQMFDRKQIFWCGHNLAKKVSSSSKYNILYNATTIEITT